MKVFYDHQIFTDQNHGGISRYFFEIMNRFKSQNEKLISSTILSNNEYLKFSDNISVVPFFPNHQFRGKARVMNLVNRLNSERILRRGNFNVFHPTYFDSYFLKDLGNKPFVLTVYDLISEKFKDQFDYFKLEEEINKHKQLMIRHASKIIAISESTKKDIIDYYQIDENKIEVIYLGNSILKTYNNQNAILPFDYVLFVGRRTLYKNFLFTIESIHEILKTNELKLVCFGGSEFSSEEIELIEKLGLKDHVIRLSQNDDHSLQNLYSNALFFIFPSLYEGFGLPLLEAFASNCPVLSSTGGSLKEVGGDAAIYFNPTDNQSLYENFDEMVQDAELRKQCVIRGQTRLAFFSWDKTFLNTHEIYRSLV